MTRKKMRFVSFDRSSGVLRMLVLSECGMCRALYIRNICNMTYAQDCLVPIITLLFSMVKRIDIVRSDDADLSELVEREGGEVTTPYSADSPLSFEDINRFCLDQHPEIDGYVKALSPLLPNQRSNMGGAHPKEYHPPRQPIYHLYQPPRMNPSHSSTNYLY